MESVAAPGVDHDALLAAEVEGIPAEDGAEVSVAALDTASGTRAVYGSGRFATASIVKADILAALLLRAQDEGRELTAREQSYAAAMIRHSDNDSATALWRAIGGEKGLDAANARFGLTGTEGGASMLWGLTRTTTADQVVLLGHIFGEDSELTESSRACLRGLMGSIAPGQDWGVSAAASGPGAGFALKNGWLPRSATGLWVVNSIGRVDVDGRGVLVAVLSSGSTSQEKGIALVEAAARAAVRIVVRDAGAEGPVGSEGPEGIAPRGATAS